MEEIFTISGQFIMYLFAVIGFFNTGRTFYKNYIKPERPKLELDFKTSLFHQGDVMVITRIVKVLNISPKTAFRIKLYISIGGSKVIIRKDSLQPAQEPIQHDHKTEIDLTVQNSFEVTDFLNDMLVIAEYRDDKGKTFYSKRYGIDSKSILLASKRKPKDLNMFIAKVSQVKKTA